MLVYFSLHWRSQIFLFISLTDHSWKLKKSFWKHSAMTPFKSLFVLYFPFFFFGKSNFTIINSLFSSKCICCPLSLCLKPEPLLMKAAFRALLLREASFNFFSEIKGHRWLSLRAILTTRQSTVAGNRSCEQWGTDLNATWNKLWPEVKIQVIRFWYLQVKKILNRQQNTDTRIQINHWIEILF